MTFWGSGGSESDFSGFSEGYNGFSGFFKGNFGFLGGFLKGVSNFAESPQESV